MANRERNVQLHFMVSPKEKELIFQRMGIIGTKNMGAYLRKMAIDGYFITVDTTDVRELVRVLRITSNSLNQIAKKANITSIVERKDVDFLINSYNKLWTMAEDIMVRLAKI